MSRLPLPYLTKINFNNQYGPMSTMTEKPSQRGLLDALFDRLLGWVSGLPPESTSYTVQPVMIPLEGDEQNVHYAADVYQPVTKNKAPAVGTILVQTPYGRSAPMSIGVVRVWAARGYNVLFTSVRGTFGSEGKFDPAMHEKADLPRVVHWMRKQPWYTGSFATFGMSYLAYTQFTLMNNLESLDDYVAAVVVVGLHDFTDVVWGTGALWLPIVDWAETSARIESTNSLKMFYDMMTVDPDGAMVPKKAVPLVDGVKAHLGADTHTFSWVEKWLTASRDEVKKDPTGQWASAKQGDALDKTNLPILLLGGWQDVFVRATMHQYERLKDRGCTVGLTVRPANHMDASNGGGVLKEAWDWMEKYMSKRQTGQIRPEPVRIKVTGSDEWRWLPSWPPATKPLELYPDAQGRLARERSEKTDQVDFTFDPHDPTPTMGGPLLFRGGSVDDTALARRADVLSFTTAPLDQDVETVGTPHVELLHSSDNPHVDIFLRLSEVNSKGVSHNLCEIYERLDPERAPVGQPVKIELDLSPCAHRFKKGTAVRLLVAGGNFPHYSYNLGSGENQATGTTLRPARHTVHLGDGGVSKLVLPVSLA